MKIRHIVSVTFFLILSLLVYLFFHLGVYKPVTIEFKEAGPFYIIYKSHVGPYHKIVPVIEEVEKWVQSQNLSCDPSFGEFIDDPKSIEAERLRSHGGCVLAQPYKGELPSGFEQRTIEKRSFLFGRFEGSPAIGPYKVYLKAFRWMEEKKYIPDGSVFEFYFIHPDKTMTTEYYFQIKSQY